jgi:hypothetical protein
MNAKTICPTAKVQPQWLGQMTLLLNGVVASCTSLISRELVENSQISGLGDQRLVSVIQYTLLKLFSRTHRLTSVMQA